MASKCRNPKDGPKIAPIGVQKEVPNLPSSHLPNTMKTTTSKAIVVIWATHWTPAPTGSRVC